MVRSPKMTADKALPRKAKRPKAIASTQSLSSFVKSICDVMRRSNCASALQYVPELTWILFLRILDAQEARTWEEAEAVGSDFSPALRSPYRWQDWAAPYSDKPDHPKTSEGKPRRRLRWLTSVLPPMVRCWQMLCCQPISSPDGTTMKPI